MKVYSLEEAAKRLGFPPRILLAFQEEGRIHPHDEVGGVRYYTQTSLDQLSQSLHCAMQRASWRDIELRMEAVEQRLESLEAELRKGQEEPKRIL